MRLLRTDPSIRSAIKPSLIRTSGLMSYAEMAEQARLIAGSVRIPVIGDGDTGYGSAGNVKRCANRTMNGPLYWPRHWKAWALKKGTGAGLMPGPYLALPARGAAVGAVGRGPKESGAVGAVGAVGRGPVDWRGPQEDLMSACCARARSPSPLTRTTRAGGKDWREI